MDQHACDVPAVSGTLIEDPEQAVFPRDSDVQAWGLGSTKSSVVSFMSEKR